MYGRCGAKRRQAVKRAERSRRPSAEPDWITESKLVAAGLAYGRNEALHAAVEDASSITNQHLMHVMMDKFKCACPPPQSTHGLPSTLARAQVPGALLRAQEVPAAWPGRLHPAPARPAPVRAPLVRTHAHVVADAPPGRSDELHKPASRIYTHTLTNVLDLAIRGSNAQFEKPYIINCLSVRLLAVRCGRCARKAPAPPAHGRAKGEARDCGWDVFTLDYKTTSPINVVFSQKAGCWRAPLAVSNARAFALQATMKYLRVFNFLWRWVGARVQRAACCGNRASQVETRGARPVLHVGPPE